MSLYVISLQPLIARLHIVSGSGSFEDLKNCWNELLESGPALGYFPNAKKCRLITEPEREEAAKEVFGETIINITTEQQKHLGAALGSRSYLEEYVGETVEDLVNQVTNFAGFASSHPQASYAAFTFGLRHRWTSFLRTPLDIECLLGPLERAIAESLVAALTGHTCTDAERNLLALPVRKGGVDLVNPTELASPEYTASTNVTAPLAEQIVSLTHELPNDRTVRSLRQKARKENQQRFCDKFEEVKNDLPHRTKRAVDLATEKGASSWLTVLPIKEMDLALNKREIKDAIHLRYDWDMNDIRSVCVCGDVFNIGHAMICRRGGFIIQRHNEVREFEAEMLNMVCYDDEVEPVLQGITGEMLPRDVNKAPDARLDIPAREFWDRQSSAFFDVRVCHPNAES